jgi:hypothetical protein
MLAYIGPTGNIPTWTKCPNLFLFIIILEFLGFFLEMFGFEIFWIFLEYLLLIQPTNCRKQQFTSTCITLFYGK